MNVEVATVEALVRAVAPATPADATVRLHAYAESLARLSSTGDLGGAQSETALVEIALADALVLAKHLRGDDAPGWEIGAGGASLMIPLAMLHDGFHGTMVEPREKRAAFLRASAGHFGLAARITIEQRRFDAATAPRGVAGLCLGRALFAPSEWVPLAEGVRRVGGRIAVLTNEPWIEPEGLSVEVCETYTLPWSGARRALTLLR